MNTIPISPDIWKLAGEVCTTKQLQVLTLRERHGFSWNQICIALNTTKSTVKEHHAAATRNVYNALEQKEGHPPSSEPLPEDFEPETPEETEQLDRFWRESAQPRPAPDA